MLVFPYTPRLLTRGYVPVSKGLAIANIAVFIVLGSLPESVTDALSLQANLFAPWQLLTYQFLHGGLFHLIGNIVFLLAFAPVVEEKLGSYRTLLFYFVGGAAAGLVWLALQPMKEESLLSPFVNFSLVGASGSISALTGASLILRPHVPMAGIFWIFIFIYRINFPVWVWALYFFLMDYLNFFQGGSSQVAYSAHLGGFVFAFFAIFLLRQVGWIQPTSSDLVSQLEKSFFKKKQMVSDVPPQKSAPTFDELLSKIQTDQEVSVSKLLSISRRVQERGRVVEVYNALQSWLEKNESAPETAQVAYELGMLCLKYLSRPDLARAWFEDVLSRNPDEQLRERTQTALSVL